MVGENHDRIKANVQKQYGESVAKTIGTSVTGFGALAQLPKWGMLAGIVRPLASAVNYFGGDWNPATAALTGGGAVGVNYSITRTRSQTYSNSLERLNRFAEAYEEALKEGEERWKRAQSEGAWRSVAFLLAKDDDTFRFAASMFKTALTERFDAHETFRIVPLANSSDDWSYAVSSIPRTFDGYEIGTDLTSSEFAALMSLPAETHPGWTSARHGDIRSIPRRFTTNRTS